MPTIEELRRRLRNKRKPESGKPRLSIEDIEQLATEGQGGGDVPSGLWEVTKRSGLAALDLLDIPRNIVASTVGAVTGTKPGHTNTLGIPTTTASDILDQLGLIKKGSWTSTGVGFAADVLTDPLTYVSGGSAGAAKKGLQKTVKGATAKIAEKGALEVGDDIGKVLASGTRGRRIQKVLDLRKSVREGTFRGKVRKGGKLEATLRRPVSERDIELTRFGVEGVGRQQQDVASWLAGEFNKQFGRMLAPAEAGKGAIGEGADAARRLLAQFNPAKGIGVKVPFSTKGLWRPTTASREIARQATKDTADLAATALDTAQEALRGAGIATKIQAPEEALGLIRRRIVQLRHADEIARNLPETERAGKAAITERIANLTEAERSLQNLPRNLEKTLRERLGQSGLRVREGQIRKIVRKNTDALQALSELTPTLKASVLHSVQKSGQSLPKAVQDAFRATKAVAEFGADIPKAEARVLQMADALVPGAAAEASSRGVANELVALALRYERSPRRAATPTQAVDAAMRNLGLIAGKAVKRGAVEQGALQDFIRAAEEVGVTGLRKPLNKTQLAAAAAGADIIAPMGKGALLKKIRDLAKETGGDPAKAFVAKGGVKPPIVQGMSGPIDAALQASRMAADDLGFKMLPDKLLTRIRKKLGIPAGREFVRTGAPTSLELRGEILMQQIQDLAAREGIGLQAAKQATMAEIVKATGQTIEEVQTGIRTVMERELIEKLSGHEDVGRAMVQWLDGNSALRDDATFQAMSREMVDEMVKLADRGEDMGQFVSALKGGYFPRITTAKAREVLSGRKGANFLKDHNAIVHNPASPTQPFMVPRSTILHRSRDLGTGEVEWILQGDPTFAAREKEFVRRAVRGETEYTIEHLSTDAVNKLAMEGKLSGLIGPEPFKIFIDDPAVAVARHTYETRLAEANRAFYSRIAEEFGVYVEDPSKIDPVAGNLHIPQSRFWEEMWNKLPDIEYRDASGQIKTRKPIVAVPKEVGEYLNSMARTFEQPETVNWAVDLANSFHTAWKASTLLVRPSVAAFFAVQAIGNAFNLAAMGVRPWHLPMLGKAVKLSKGQKAAFDLVQIGGERLASERLIQEMFDQRIFSHPLSGGGSSWAMGPDGANSIAVEEFLGNKLTMSSKVRKTLFEKGGKWNPLGRLFEFNRVYIDDSARVWSYMVRRHLGDTPEQAAMAVKRYLFDYEMKPTAFEKTFLHPFVPFARWMKNNTALQISELAKQPRYAAVLPKLQNIAQQNSIPQELAPEWFKESIGIQVSGDEKGGTYALAGNLLPTQELRAVLDPMRFFVSTLSPIAKAPFEISMNRNLFTGRDLTRYPDESVWLAWARENTSMWRELRRLGFLAGDETPTGYKVARAAFGGRLQYMDVEQQKQLKDIETSKQLMEIRRGINRADFPPERRRKLAVMYFQVLQERQKSGLGVPRVASLGNSAHN